MAIAALVAGEPVSNSGPPEVKRYFKGFAGYKHPLRLVDEMSEQQAARWSGAVYEGHYVEQRLVEVVKTLKKKVVAQYRYRYSSSGELLEAQITNADGVTKTIVFGAGGQQGGR